MFSSFDSIPWLPPTEEPQPHNLLPLNTIEGGYAFSKNKTEHPEAGDDTDLTLDVIFWCIVIVPGHCPLDALALGCSKDEIRRRCFDRLRPGSDAGPDVLMSVLALKCSAMKVT